ncbi:unnamed protein product [Owenia fusiformis]|uniref:Uncharacterized protein n=1 Tax=Owenia fusiformis TaxID=6347 RepID=A0A8J1UCB3_OWEFU|nr:unnamed protein product [Owenia fusiformis]
MLSTRMSSTTPTPPNEVGMSENKFTDSKRASDLLLGMSSLYANKQMSDVTLVVDNQDYPCHRNILAISSPFFMAMFTNDLAEKQQDKIKLKDLDSKTMELILDYIYTGTVNLCEETVPNLLSAANLFQLLSLRDGCATFMTKHVTISNCIGVYFFAKAHQCIPLANSAKEILMSRFTILCREQEFLSLPYDKLIEIIKCSDLSVVKEEKIYEACITWLNCNTEERLPYLPQIMQYIRFANISSYYFCDKIDKNPSFVQSEELKEILQKVRYCHMLKNRHHEMDLDFRTRAGMPEERVIVVMANPYAEDNVRKYNSMDALIPETGEVKHICKLPNSLFMPAAAVTGDNKIFLSGGTVRKFNYRGSISNEGVVQSLYMFDDVSCVWLVKKPMIYARFHHKLTVVDGYIFAIGGQNNQNEYLNSVEKYDLQSNIWTQVEPMPKIARCVAATSYRGDLYVFGGESKTEVYDSVYRYNLLDDQWTDLPPMSIGRSLAGCGIYKDKIYIIGGNSALSNRWKRDFIPEECVNTVEVFDPETNSWGTGPDLPNAVCGAAVVKHGCEILVVGGEDANSWMAGSCRLRDVDGVEKWIEEIELQSVMSAFACVTANIPKEFMKDIDSVMM